MIDGIVNMGPREPRTLAELLESPKYQNAPEAVKEAMRQFPPWKYYRYQIGNVRAAILGYHENKDFDRCDLCVIMIIDPPHWGRVVPDAALAYLEDLGVNKWDVP